TRERGVIHDTVDTQPIVVFHADGAVSALDARRISASRSDGTVGVFEPCADGRALTFRPTEDGRFIDAETGSTWTVTGRAVEGPLEGKQLPRIDHGNYFAFAWLAFRPDSRIGG
ncbi:MAG TPA: DUF3179 domain-containing (seleno)protein, partial [Sandaracinaceae bacterium LLY-WYZ-13_1]|nr:DUF3179 domain-containing (seleno)protein [Sandaracinaceae bacterium LLY-WYZ-13_1]